MIISVPSEGADGNYFYVVRNGDIATELLRKFKIRPIYGNAGALKKLSEVNPQINNLNQIKPNEKIYFPDDFVATAETRERISITAEKEILERSRQVASEATVKTEPAPSAPVATPAPVVSAPAAVEPAARVDAPVAPAEIAAPADEKVPHELSLFARYNYTTISATDNTTSTLAEILTARDVDAGVTWSQRWSREIGTYQTFVIRSVSFEPTPPGSKQLNTLEKSATRFAFGFDHHITEKIDLRYSFGYSQEMFVRGFNSTSVVVETVAVPSFSLEGRLDLFSKDATTVQARFGYQAMLSGQGQNFTVESGEKLSGGLFLKKETGWSKLELGFGYEQRNQNTSLTAQTESGAYGLLQFTFPIFEDAGGKP